MKQHVHLVSYQDSSYNQYSIWVDRNIAKNYARRLCRFMKNSANGWIILYLITGGAQGKTH